MGLNKIILHWTAGTNIPNSNDRLHYHFLINGTGNIIPGKYRPEDNINCVDGKYAEHCGGGNTGAIGVSFCGMLGFENSKHIGNYPLTERQCEAGFKFIAGLCKKYSIPVKPQSVLTHYEFGQAHIKTSSFGKVDIIHLPPYPKIKAADCGDFIRQKIQWYLEKI